jgi:hypothetical protein
MSLHVCILGIDGSGKTTVTTAAPMLLAGEFCLSAASAGEEFRVRTPEEDHLVPGFQPDGLPLVARSARRLKRLAKRYVNNCRVYPFFKLTQMLCQDAAARKLGRRPGVACVISDGNTFLSTMGRAANYRRPASDSVEGLAPNVNDLCAVFRYVLQGEPLPEASRARLPNLGKARQLYRVLRRLGIQGVWLPDAVVFLDLPPQLAVQRIGRRGQPVDRHENEADLMQTRDMYLKTLEAFRNYGSPDTAHLVTVDGLPPGAVLRAVFEALRPQILAQQQHEAAQGIPLGTTATELTGKSLWAKALNFRYLFGYLLAKFFRGAWREPLFAFSEPGRLFLKEGYSANVMRVIYDQDEKRPSRLDRVFLNYPLHRAVYDRLQILTQRIEQEVEARLRSQDRVTIFTAPSGFAYDLFRPLKNIASCAPALLPKVHVVAADLDPHGQLAEALKARAAELRISFTFLRGDLTKEAFRRECAIDAPYSLALFVGLSSWFPKPETLRHVRWVHKHLRVDSVFLTDCFTPEAYSLSGRYVGYKAHYYTPEEYRLLLDYCGFDGLGATVASGRDRINHVLVAKPRLSG